jgi:hypothetical protein
VKIPDPATLNIPVRGTSKFWTIARAGEPRPSRAPEIALLGFALEYARFCNCPRDRRCGPGPWKVDGLALRLSGGRLDIRALLYGCLMVGEPSAPP